MTPTEQVLGDEFEKIFENYIKEVMKPADLERSRFRRGTKTWREGTGRNTRPDFIGDDEVNGGYFPWDYQPKRIEEGSIWEVKQKSGGVYLSTNGGQIRGHLKNLAAKHAGNRRGGYTPMFTLVTTADVSYSYTSYLYAWLLRINYVHLRAKYKIINGKYYFKFESVVHERLKQFVD